MNFRSDGVNKVVGGGKLGGCWRWGFLCMVASMNGRLAV